MLQLNVPRNWRWTSRRVEMGSVTGNVSAFLIDTLIDIYIVIVLLRFLLALVKADFYNPISQFLVIATKPLLVPMRYALPNIQHFDTAAVVLMLILKISQLWLLTSLAGVAWPVAYLLIRSVLELFELVIFVYIFAVIVQVLFSWLAPAMNVYQNPAVSIIYSLTEPLMQPARKIIPSIGMVDISPIIVILALNVVLVVIRSLY